MAEDTWYNQTVSFVNKIDIFDEGGLIKIDVLPPIVGENGLSAYGVAIDNGFIGTEEEWLLSLVGADGQSGPKGDTGLMGPQGEQGLQGYQGIQGIQGFKGDTGDTGPAGEDGSDALVTKENVEAVLTGEISSHTHAGAGGGLTQAQILTRQL
jgi:hypothetical protein